MANTPFDDLGTEEILSTRISGIQDAVKNIEQSLNMDTEAVSEESLTLLADTMGRYRIAEAVGKRNWLNSPAPVIEQYIEGSWTQISTGFDIDYAGGAVIFADDKVGEQFRASFTRVKNTSGHNSHSTQHEYGGDDEISLEDLPGESAALKTHKSDFMPHGVDNAGFRNSIYRGKNLGTSVTTEQYNNIANGTFKDLYIGDYWTINGTKYLIAAFNYYYNAGDTALTQNHVTLVPESTMYNHEMNDIDTTDGGYVGSKMYTEGLDQAKNTIATDFSGHVVNHRKYLCNAVTDGEASAGAWMDSEVELMNEIMVCGSVVNGHAIYGLYNVGIEKTQLPLFALRPDIANIRDKYWLRDVSSAKIFASVHDNGLAGRGGASTSRGVRPVFSIS